MTAPLIDATHAGHWPDTSAAVQTALTALAAGDLAAVMAALRTGSPQQAALTACLLPQTDADMALPCTIGDYSAAGLRARLAQFQPHLRRRAGRLRRAATAGGPGWILLAGVEGAAQRPAVGPQ